MLRMIHEAGRAGGRRCRLLTLAALAAAACLAAAPAAADVPAGTFSIVARDSVTGEVGVAVQSKVFGVGPRVAWALGGAGAVATQAQSNESFGPDGLRLLAAGLSAGETLDWLLARDPARDNRQVGVVDAKGGVAAWTGAGCSDWAGDSSGVDFTCQGNILAGPAVVAEMARAFGETSGQELARRLLAALEAAQAAGGDRRGRQSAAILIGRPHPDYPEYARRYVDIRVEDHATPIAELRRLYEMYEAQGLVQAHLRFSEWMEAAGDSAGARRERERVGEVLVRALERNIEDAGTLNALAWFTATHDIFLEQALEAARRAVALSPEDSNILDTLAEAHFRLAQVDEAIAVERRALALSPDDAYLQEQIARFEAARR
ncbi:MAG: DUF1028 domain-containing protein [Candidatus Krumholzibacteriota bacterium]|nr:DUF1028 domain-containing protein [Candidatus Krumholzibacteriota bacterium]